MATTKRAFFGMLVMLHTALLHTSMFRAAKAEVDSQVPAPFSDDLWFTAIQRAHDSKFRCSGSLIGSRYVVTAEHCVDSPQSVVVEVSYLCVSRDNCGRESDSIGVKEVFRHPLGGDMALLVLDRAVNLTSTIQPAVPYLGSSMHPSQRRLKKGRRMRMVAAGGTASSGGELSDYVTWLPLRQLSKKNCRERLDPSLVTEFMVCSVIDGFGSPCPGDSGGALVVPGRGKFRGRDVVVAIHNAGPRDCSGADKDLPFLHFRMQDAASLLQLVVCRGDFPEDWCGETEQPQLVCADGSRPHPDDTRR